MIEIKKNYHIPKGIWEKYVYFKMCWGTGQGNLSIPVSIFGDVVQFSIFLKVFNIEQYWIIVVLGIVKIIIMSFVGHFILRRGLAAREVSISNRYNPELQELLKQTKK